MAIEAIIFSSSRTLLILITIAADADIAANTPMIFHYADSRDISQPPLISWPLMPLRLSADITRLLAIAID
jgi:hypothetical protein